MFRPGFEGNSLVQILGNFQSSMFIHSVLGHQNCCCDLVFPGQNKNHQGELSIVITTCSVFKYLTKENINTYMICVFLINMILDLFIFNFTDMYSVHLL